MERSDTQQERNGMWGPWHSLGKAPMEQHGLGLVREEGAGLLFLKGFFVHAQQCCELCYAPVNV